MKIENKLFNKFKLGFAFILGFLKYAIYNPNIVRIGCALIFYIIVFLISNHNYIAYADIKEVTSDELQYYLRLLSNNYKVFDNSAYSLPEEIYPSFCNLDKQVSQRFDSYCLDSKVLADHWSGRNPAYECCQKYGIDWHRSYIIYSKNMDANKPYYPGWEEALLNPKINPDFLPVPQGARYGFSDWERGGSSYQWLLYSEAKELVNWFDSGRFQHTFKYVNSNIESLKVEDLVYGDFLNRANNGEILSVILDAKNLLNEIEIRGIKFEQPSLELSKKECVTCK